MAEKECLWEEEDDYYMTTCGLCFTFNDGKAGDNDFNFCPKCGEKLVDITGDSAEGQT